MHLRVEIEPEADGRWLAEIPDMPGVMVYGASRDEAPLARCKHSHCASWRIDGNMEEARA